MENVTKELMNEHQIILKMIDITLEECDRIEKGNVFHKDVFADIIKFIKNYADGYHHAKEEEILFKTMLENLENMHCNPIPVMIHEHEEGRYYVKKMQESLQNLDNEMLVENARCYCFLLKNHIFKEDNVLYPMAEASMSDTEKQNVNRMYEQVQLSNFIDMEIDSFVEHIQNTCKQA